MRLASSVRWIVALAAAAAVATPLMLRAQGRDGGGITVYESSDFRGDNITIDRDVPDLRAFGFARQISSFRFRAGESWEVCTGRNFTGRCRVFTESINDLRRSDWNDTIMLGPTRPRRSAAGCAGLRPRAGRQPRVRMRARTIPAGGSSSRARRRTSGASTSTTAPSACAP